MGQQRLRLFPFGTSTEKSIPLPFPIGNFAFASDGRTLYAQAGLGAPISTPPRTGVLKVEFNPTRVSLVMGSNGLYPSFGLAVSAHQDKILISGSYWNGISVACGVFELMVKDRRIRRVLPSADCHAAAAWRDLSLSPDGLRAVAIHKGELELADLARGSVKSLTQGVFQAAWSPDGRWIAARETTDQERTVLFDADTLTRERTFGGSETVWSPDSRYLLAWKWHILCGPYFFTLEKVDVETGQRTTIGSSRCKVIEGSVAWVSSNITP
jgi:WD40 repeat protein